MGSIDISELGEFLDHVIDLLRKEDLLREPPLGTPPEYYRREEEILNEKIKEIILSQIYD